VNCRWESHVASKEPMLGGLHGELLGCWICWEYDQNWVKPMVPEDWVCAYETTFKVDGYRICKGKRGGDAEEAELWVKHCPKIHS